LDLKGGGDLRYYLRKRLIFEESDVAFFVACIGSALEFIHSRNILHRDVKPENIILDSRGFPHLTGMGRMKLPHLI
jgi:serine/threonine protein kinase